MKVIVFGATGMVGQGVLRECLLDPTVDDVLAVGRSVTGQAHPKLRELVHADFFDWSAHEAQLAGYDACLFCLGVTSLGMKEDAYRHLTYDLTLSVANVLARLNPAMTFIYVTGQGTDSTEQGRVMWARVKGRTENELLSLGFKAAYMFRPGAIQASKGIVSKTPVYRVLYIVLSPLFTLLKWISPDLVTSTEQIGRAMLIVARRGAPKPILETRDINAIC